MTGDGDRHPQMVPKPAKKRGGRKAGVKNKLTKALKEMILGALDDVGGQRYLAHTAVLEPKAFLALLGRVLPTTLAGADGGPLVIKVVRFADK